MDERIVEIAGDEGSSPGRYMQYVFDAGTGTYLRPADSEQMLAFRERGVKAAYLQAQAGSEFDADALERAWPEIWRELTRKRPEPTPEYYAVLDTGLLSRHPLVRGLIVDGTNLTTEPDGEDANGHGTMVALILAAGLTRRPRILNVKVADGNGRATPRDLVRGIEWVRAFARRTSSPVCVNSSLGRTEASRRRRVRSMPSASPSCCRSDESPPSLFAVTAVTIACSAIRIPAACNASSSRVIASPGGRRSPRSHRDRIDSFTGTCAARLVREAPRCVRQCRSAAPSRCSGDAEGSTGSASRDITSSSIWSILPP
nr:S8 family serine peptidase [Microbispora triticiradicis]